MIDGMNGDHTGLVMMFPQRLHTEIVRFMGGNGGKE